jgi:hypothetical protein
MTNRSLESSAADNISVAVSVRAQGRGRIWLPGQEVVRSPAVDEGSAAVGLPSHLIPPYDGDVA